MKLTESLRRFPAGTAALVLLFSVVGSHRTAAAQDPGKAPTLHVPHIDCELAVDGKLNEPCWKKAAGTGALPVLGDGPGKSTIEAFILRDADHLYVGVSCGFTGGADGGERPQPPDWVELMIDSNGDRDSYYLIRLSRRDGGKVLSSYNEYDPPWCDRTWQPALRWAIANQTGRWTAEFAFPFAMFNKNRKLVSRIGFNVRGSGTRDGQTYCWAGRSWTPDQAGILTGIPARDGMPEPEYRTRGLTRWYRPPNKAGRKFLADQAKHPIALGPGSSHPGTTGEVRLELEGFLLAGDPHARGIIWDLAADERKGELFVLSDNRLVRGVAELRVFDRQGRYLRAIMPLNPNLPRSRVQDLCRTTAREGGAELVVPKMFLPWGEPSMYGDWWHHPQKMTLTPDGDLVLSNLYRGTVWRMKPDGSLPAERWTSAYHRGRNEPFDSTAWTQESWHVPDLKNYLPFHALHYPYFCFGPDGLLYVSAGQTSRPTRHYAYYLEVAESDVRYHWPVESPEQRRARVWKCQLHAGVKLAQRGWFDGFSQPCGLAFDGNTLIVADAGNNRLQVLQGDGRIIASITQYEQDGKQYALHDPTALAIDHDRHLYVLIGSEKRPADARAERTLPILRRHVVAQARRGAGSKPRRLIKLSSWQHPELLAVSRPLHPDVLQIAVDAGVSPPLVWVANGTGPGSLMQLAGNDLSLKAQWSDDGRTLSCPRQSGGQPILNIDPVTGHLYVEDDSNYRIKQFGTVYRLDQHGKVLKTWEPRFFDARDLKMTSPWGTLNYQRHFRAAQEPLSIDSIFGKDGRVYRWKLSAAGVEILRLDRAGKPIPFKATGTNALFVDPAMRANFWHDVYHGMDVDRQGNIYYVAKVDVDPKSRPVSAYDALHRQINVYDAQGRLRERGLLILDCVRGIQVDDAGNLYVVYRPAERPWEEYLALAKFPPSGGRPLWSRPWQGFLGAAQVANAPCHCTTSRFHQSLDGHGYLYVAAKYSVQVIDCKTGKLVGQFGSYGNLDCGGKGSRFPHPDLPFGTIWALSVWKDRLFAVDVTNRRIVKCRIVHGQAVK